MSNFIHCESKKKVYRLPGDNKLANAREWWRLVMWLTNSLIENLKPVEDDGKMCLLNFAMYFQTARRYFYPKLISALEFLSN